MGRPSKATEARTEALLVAIRAGSTREAAATHAGINRSTFSRWMASNAGFRAQVEKAEADVEVRCVAGIIKWGEEDWHSYAWWLSHRRPETYGPGQAKAKADAAAASPSQLPPHPLDDLTPAEQAERAQEWASRLATAAAQPPTSAAAASGR